LAGPIVSTKAEWTPSKRRVVGDRRKRRRSWPLAEKRWIVAETLVPGAPVSVVVLRYDVNANQVFKWQRELAANLRADEEVVLPAKRHRCHRRPGAVVVGLETAVIEIGSELLDPGQGVADRLGELGLPGSAGQLALQSWLQFV
jgi:transposase-like protein